MDGGYGGVTPKGPPDTLLGVESAILLPAFVWPDCLCLIGSPVAGVAVVDEFGPDGCSRVIDEDP